MSIDRFIATAPGATAYGQDLIPPARSWRPNRPGDLNFDEPEHLQGESLRGTPGPDGGYALGLAAGISDSLHLGPHEHAHDAVAVIAAVAMRRAASVGRAPILRDVQAAAAILGYDDDAPGPLVTQRRLATNGASHDYRSARALVDAVADDLLSATIAEIHVARRDRWRDLGWVESVVVDEDFEEDADHSLTETATEPSGRLGAFKKSGLLAGRKSTKHAPPAVLPQSEGDATRGDITQESAATDAKAAEVLELHDEFEDEFSDEFDDEYDND